MGQSELWTVREVVITSILDEDPPCVGVGGYARYHLSDKTNGQNLLA